VTRQLKLIGSYLLFFVIIIVTVWMFLSGNQEKNSSSETAGSEKKAKPIEAESNLEMEVEIQENEEKEPNTEEENTPFSENNNTVNEPDESQKEIEKNHSTTKGEPPYTGGRDLSKDPNYKAELRKIYSQEDIDRLYAPRKWVIMPNVVGMSEREALKKLHSLGLVGRVVYEDQGKKEGNCYMQEIAAGNEWNTDASIFIWIQRTEETTQKVSEKPKVMEPSKDTGTKKSQPKPQPKPEAKKEEPVEHSKSIETQPESEQSTTEENTEDDTGEGA